MVAPPDIATRMAARIFDRIERDRSLILQNIEQEIREQLILQGAAAPVLTPHGVAVDALISAATAMCTEIVSHGLHGSVAACFDRAFRTLDLALGKMQP